MNFHTRYLLILGIFCSATASATGNWIDAISFTFGQDKHSTDIQVYRLGLQNNWERTWFNGGAWYVDGYWDADLAYMDAGDNGRGNEGILDLSLTPVFRMQRDTDLSSGVSPFAEAGIGPHLFSKTRLGGQRFSTALQFGSLIGFGVGFGENGQYKFGYRFQYISNAGIKTPNDGANLHQLRLVYSFQ